jgi:hypothetical protein
MNKWILAAVTAALVIIAAVWFFIGNPFAPEAKIAEVEAINPLNQDHCHTLAPDGWLVQDSNAGGTIFTASSIDHTMVAGYVGLKVPGAVAQGGNGQPPSPPATFVKQMAQVFTGAPIESTLDAPKFGAYQVMTVTSGQYGGYILYHAFAVTTDPKGYGLIMRIALGPKDDKHAIAAAGSVAAATRCDAVAIPQKVDLGLAHGTGTTGACREGHCDDVDLAGSYNAQFGIGWAHDSNGQNYNVDVMGDFSESGPDGPGYYAEIDGEPQRLEPGLQ